MAPLCAVHTGQAVPLCWLTAVPATCQQRDDLWSYLRTVCVHCSCVVQDLGLPTGGFVVRGSGGSARAAPSSNTGANGAGSSAPAAGHALRTGGTGAVAPGSAGLSSGPTGRTAAAAAAHSNGSPTPTGSVAPNAAAADAMPAAAAARNIGGAGPATPASTGPTAAQAGAMPAAAGARSNGSAGVDPAGSTAPTAAAAGAMPAAAGARSNSNQGAALTGSNGANAAATGAVLAAAGARSNGGAGVAAAAGAVPAAAGAHSNSGPNAAAGGNTRSMPAAAGARSSCSTAGRDAPTSTGPAAAGGSGLNSSQMGVGLGHTRQQHSRTAADAAADPGGRAPKRHCSGLPAHAAAGSRPLGRQAGVLGAMDGIGNLGPGCAPVNLVSRDADTREQAPACGAWGLDGAEGAAAAAAAAESAARVLAPQYAPAAYNNSVAAGSAGSVPPSSMGVDAATASGTAGTNSSSIWADIPRLLEVKRYLEYWGYGLLPGPILNVLQVRVPAVRIMMDRMYKEVQAQYVLVVMSGKRDAMGVPTAEFGRLFVAHAPPGPSRGPLLYDLRDLVPREVHNQVMYMASQANVLKCLGS